MMFLPQNLLPYIGATVALLNCNHGQLFVYTTIQMEMIQTEVQFHINVVAFSFHVDVLQHLKCVNLCVGYILHQAMNLDYRPQRESSESGALLILSTRKFMVSCATPDKLCTSYLRIVCIAFFVVCGIFNLILA